MFRRLTFSTLLFVAGLSAGLVVSGRMRFATESRANTPPPSAAQSPSSTARPQPAAVQSPPARPSPAPGLPGVGAPDFTRIAASAVRGVANISSLQVVRAPNGSSDPFFRYFFGDGDEVFGSRDRRSLSLGSGVIISADGYVVTNNHVVGENVRDITVALPDKREIKGRVVGVDPSTDIALLKIDVAGLPAVPWG